MGKIAAVLLAAGSSDRFGTGNKLLADLAGRPLIRGVAEEILRSTVSDVVAVAGCDRQAIAAALAGLPVRLVHNDNWQAGMGTSIAAGVSALGADIDGAFIVPGDMPHLPAELLNELAATFAQEQGASIVFPATPAGAQRNPVLWPARHFPKLKSLSGREGAKALLQRLGTECVAVPAEDEAVFADVDTPADLEAARSAERP